MRWGSADDVAQALNEACRGQRSAVFLIGAGCSVSAGIPSAGEIIDYVRCRHPQAYATAPALDYPSVMDRVPWQTRYALFHHLVRVAGLNWAHVGLALLMHRRLVGRVLTTNFDDLALRACALYGLYPSTHDLAISAALGGPRGGAESLQYRDSLLREPAVLYLHGRHNGFAQKHSNEQLERQAGLLEPVIAGAKRRPRPWVVVGYSGESDPLFETVRVGGFPGGLFWVNLAPPTGAAARALRAADGLFIAADADSFFLDLLRGTIGGGRELLLPAMLHPAAALSLLPAPAKGRAPAPPRADRLRRVLNQAFIRAAERQGAPARDTADDGEASLRAGLARAEGMWRHACGLPPGPAFLRAASSAEAAFHRAIGGLQTRDEALAGWSRELFAGERDSTAAGAGWRDAYRRYRRARKLEFLVAWTLGRAGTVLATRAHHGAVSTAQLNERRQAIEALRRSIERPPMALEVGVGDLRLAAAMRKRAASATAGAGSELLRQAADAYLRACRAGADCPPGDRRAGALQALARAVRRRQAMPRSLDSVRQLRERILEASGL